jgi:hypothetical protein
VKIIAIDPGPVESAFVILDGATYRPLLFGKVENQEMRKIIRTETFDRETDRAVIEMVASYGMPVGAEVFETCVWIGRFYECLFMLGLNPQKMFRREVKTNLCQDSRAKDSNIRQALLDRFGPVGVKKTPGFFYGFKKDIWAAMAVGVTWLDTNKI